VVLTAKDAATGVGWVDAGAFCDARWVLSLQTTIQSGHKLEHHHLRRQKGTYVPICATRVTVDSDRGNCTAYNRMFVDWPPDAQPDAKDVTRSE
jgi:hypothetical protein